MLHKLAKFHYQTVFRSHALSFRHIKQTIKNKADTTFK